MRTYDNINCNNGHKGYKGHMGHKGHKGRYNNNNRAHGAQRAQRAQGHIGRLRAHLFMILLDFQHFSLFSRIFFYCNIHTLTFMYTLCTLCTHYVHFMYTLCTVYVHRSHSGGHNRAHGAQRAHRALEGT